MMFSGHYVDDEKATATVHIAINAFDLYVEEDLDTPNHVIPSTRKCTN